MKHAQTRLSLGMRTLIVMAFMLSLFSGNAIGQEQAVTAAPTPDAAKKPGKLVITGDNLDIDSKNKIATYTGNVKVVQGDTTMFSDTLKIFLDATGRQLEKAIATGNVRIVSASGMATGEEGTFYNTEQKIELTKHAKVWQENNTITANRIVAFLQEKIVEGYSDETDERVVMTIYSTGDAQSPFDLLTGATPTPAPEASPSDQKQQASPNGKAPKKDAAKNEKTAAKKTEKEEATPIVITSDTLRMDNATQQATFSGDVIVTKAPTEIRSDEMVVYIVKTAEERNDIDKIEVFGHVKITHETNIITGEKGEFLKQKQFAKVEGSSSKKARAENTAQNLTVEAPVIHIDLKTNQIKASGGVGTQKAGEAAEPGSQRIRTEFGTDDAQSLIDQPPAEKSSEQPSFALTEDAFKKLKQENVPDTILEKLDTLKGQTYSTEKAFLDAVVSQIGKEKMATHKKTLLKHGAAKKAAKKKNSDQPSVTIYPKGKPETEKAK